MDGRGILRFGCCLGTAFSPHGIRITQAQFSHQHYAGIILLREEGCSSSPSTTTNDQDIYVIIHRIKINNIGIDPAITLQ